MPLLLEIRLWERERLEVIEKRRALTSNIRQNVDDTSVLVGDIKEFDAEIRPALFCELSH